VNIKRANRISEEVRRAASEIIYNGIKDPRVDSMTTVTKVEVTRDLSFANIYVSVLGDDKKKQDTLDGLRSAKGFFRKEIGQKVDLRHVPEPIFHLDESTEYALHMNELIQKVSAEDKKNRTNRDED